MSYRDTGYLSILVIDDDEEIRGLIVDFLTGEGHLVIPAGSAEAGLEQLPYHRFDIAFLNHHLPGMEGLVLGEYLKRNNPDMQIALVTGGADARIERLVAEHGLQLVRKPFDLEQLLEIIDEYTRAMDALTRAPAQHDVLHLTPDIAGHYATLPAWFRGFNVPQRLEEHLSQRTRSAIDALRFGEGDAEAMRVAALAGLLAAQVLGVKLPRHKDGRTMFAHYDELMVETGRAPAFGEDRERRDA